MRNLSLTLRGALNAEQTDKIEVFLVTVSDPSLATPLRFSSDPTARVSGFNVGQPLGLLLALTGAGFGGQVGYGTVSRGQVYNFLPMSLVLPDDTQDAPPAVKIVLDGITRETIPLLRSVSAPPTVTLEMVLADAPDVVEVDFGEFDLVSASYDALQVMIELTVSALATEPFPRGTFTPTQFPGLF